LFCKNGGDHIRGVENEITNLQQYIYLKHQPIAKLEDKQIIAIHSDHLGTPRIATNDQKETVWKANYSPFGKATIEINKITLNLRLPGQYHDGETGTHYNYLRDYDPETGRYITSDPIGLKGGMNTYTYALADPLRKIDTLGTWSWPWESATPPSAGEEGSEVIDQIKNYMSSAGDKMIETLVGENFKKMGESIFGTLPQAYEDLVFENPKYEKPSIGELQIFMSESALDIVYTMMVLAAIEKGANFVINKPNPWTFLGGKAVKFILKQGVRAFVLYQFGSAGVGFYDTIYDIGEKMADLKNRDINNDCYIGDELYEISKLLARSSADFVLASGDGLRKFKSFKDKFSFRNKSCKKASASDSKKCYKNINGLKKLSGAQIKKLETALGVFTKVCTSKK